MNTRIFKYICAAGFFNLFLLSGVNAWTIEESFDGSAVGAACPTFADSDSVVSSTTFVSGGKSCKHGITGGKFGFGEWGGIINFPNNLSKGDEIWIRIRTNFPIGFDYDGNPRLKFMRVRTWTADRGNRGYLDWYLNNKGKVPPFAFIYEGFTDGEAWAEIGTADDAINLGVWETYEFYIKLDTQSVDMGGTGRMRAWKNGVLLKDMTNRVTLRVASDYADSFYLFTYWNNPSNPTGAPKTQSMHIDDLVITTDQPLNKDSFGNSVIGMSGFVPAPLQALPSSPLNLKVK